MELMWIIYLIDVADSLKGLSGIAVGVLAFSLKVLIPPTKLALVNERI